MTLGEITRILDLPDPAEPTRVVRQVASLSAATDTDLSFITTDRFLDLAAASKAGVILVSESVPLTHPTATLLVVPDAELAVAKLLPYFSTPPHRPIAGLHASAVVDPSAKLAPDACVGAGATIGPNSTIGERTILHPGVRIGADVVIGDDCELWPGVVCYDRVTLGRRVVVHAGTVIGADGFGYKFDGKRHVKIPHVGTVVIEDDVEIGANCCIDRAKFGETRIGFGTKIDNLVQIAHNVRIGPMCILAGQSGVAGSATLGRGVVVGGGSGIRDHVTIGDGAMVAAVTSVMKDIAPGEVVAGYPARDRRAFFNEIAALARLPELLDRVRDLENERRQ